MTNLQNRVQSAEGNAGNIQKAMQDLEVIGQMVQEMNQALTQEINRRQGNPGGSGAGGDGSGSGGGNGGHGNGGNQ